eukprot:7040765-Karenia_brevis.AAC.1
MMIVALVFALSIMTMMLVFALSMWIQTSMVWPRSLELVSWATWLHEELTVGMVWPKGLEL